MKDPYSNLVELRDNLECIVKDTDWLSIMKQTGPEKQIEIRAEVERSIKRINKELK